MQMPAEAPKAPSRQALNKQEMPLGRLMAFTRLFEERMIFPRLRREEARKELETEMGYRWAKSRDQKIYFLQNYLSDRTGINKQYIMKREGPETYFARCDVALGMLKKLVVHRKRVWRAITYGLKGRKRPMNDAEIKAFEFERELRKMKRETGQGPHKARRELEAEMEKAGATEPISRTFYLKKYLFDRLGDDSRRLMEEEGAANYFAKCEAALRIFRKLVMYDRGFSLNPFEWQKRAQRPLGPFEMDALGFGRTLREMKREFRKGTS